MALMRAEERRDVRRPDPRAPEPSLIAPAPLVVYYFAWARSRLKGPRVQGGDEELTEIEREFQQAAQGLETA